MISRVAVFGAGSVGLHHARAWSKAGSEVDVFDISKEAISRSKDLIWPGRYGAPAPNEVDFRHYAAVSSLTRGYDLVIIGTPPDSHLDLLRQILDNQMSSIIMIQKPVSPPGEIPLDGFRAEAKRASVKGIKLLSGYNHRHSPLFSKFIEEIQSVKSSGLNSAHLEVSWREPWGGILAAHPWLADIHESYLGHTARGGGALFEHSHGLDLGLLSFGLVSGDSNAILRDASLTWSNSELHDTDAVAVFSDQDQRFVLTVNQGVLVKNTEKSLRFTSSPLKMELTFSSDLESLMIAGTDRQVESLNREKTRESDFDMEVHALKEMLSGSSLSHSAIDLWSFDSALETSEKATEVLGCALRA